MVYAYDKNIQMPVMDLYDNLIMAMAINAAKDLYDDAQKRLDEFYDKYGDFYSPWKKDQLWYEENVINRVNNELESMYLQGIDPLRNAEGRSRLQSLMRKMPIGTINAMKRNAKVGEKFLQNAADLLSKGLYNPDMDAWENGQFQEFSTVGDNGLLMMWDKQSPSPYMDLDTLLEPIIKNVKPSYDEARTKADRGKIWKTITLPRLMQAFNDNMSDILSTPSGKYLLHLSQLEADAINSAVPGSNITALDVLKNKASNRLSDHTYEEFSYDPLYLKQIEHLNKLSEARYAASLQNPSPLAPLQFSQRIQMNIEDKYNTNVRKKSIEYAKASLENAKRKESQLTKKEKLKYGSKFWQDVINKLEDPNSDLSTLQKYGFVDKYGNPSERLNNFALSQYKKKDDGVSYWNGRSYTPASDYEKDVTRNLLSGSDRFVSIMGGKYNTISLGDKGIRYAPYRYASLIGNTSKLSSVQKEFQSWLNNGNIQGYVDNSPVDVAIIPRANGNNLTDLRGNVLISEHDIKDFVSKIKGRAKYGPESKEFKEIISKLGLKKRIDRSGFEKTNWTDLNYYVVPIIRSTDITMDDINQQYNHAVYGGTNASGERNIATEEGLEWYYNN